MARVRYYTYKVTSLDLADYLALGKDSKIPLFIDYVPVKRNAADAQLEILSKTPRRLVFLSTVRAPKRKTPSISSVKVTRLTKRQILIVDKVVAQTQTTTSLPYTLTTAASTANTSTFTVTASTIADTTTVSTSGTIDLGPINQIVIPPVPVVEPICPRRDEMTERAEEDDRSVWDDAHPQSFIDVNNCGTCGQEPNSDVTGEYPCPECSVPQLHDDEPEPVLPPQPRLSRWISVGIPTLIAIGILAALWAAHVWR